MNKCIDMKLSACQTPHVIKISGMHKSNHETYQQGGFESFANNGATYKITFFFPRVF